MARLGSQGRSPRRPLIGVELPRPATACRAARDPELPPRLLRLDVDRADHLGPLLSFLSDKSSELGGRTTEYRAT